MLKVTLYNTNMSTIRDNTSFGAQKLLPDKFYKKKPIKLIGLDIDGVISDRVTNSVTSEVKKAISDVVNKGIKIILNTGRDYEETEKISQELALETPVICNYGKYIKQKGQIIYENPSDKVDLKGDSLKYLAKLWKIPQKNIMTIGNDVEDVSMFKKSGTAVLVEGGSSFEEIEKFADYTVSNQTKSAVALIIEKLIL